MRKLVVLIVILFGFGGLLGLGALTALLSSSGGGGGQQDSAAGCSVDNSADATARGQRDAATLSPASGSIAQRIIDIGKQRNLPPRAWQIALQAGMTESHLANLPGGDRDSLGIFQMRPSQGWGTPAQLNNVDYEINKFYDKLLANVPGWQQMRPGDAAQAVEQSAFPLRYQQWEPMAAHLISTDGHVQGVDGCANLPPASVLAQRAIGYALGQIGKLYVWGAAGPDSFDCSGLVQQAWKAAGIDIPKYTQTQYEQGGQQIPLSQAQPGDLIFWGYGRNPQATHHVALYLGNNEVVQAPQPGETVQRSKLWDGGELLPMAVRPIPHTAAQAVGTTSTPSAPQVPAVGVGDGRPSAPTTRPDVGVGHGNVPAGRPGPP